MPGRFRNSPTALDCAAPHQGIVAILASRQHDAKNSQCADTTDEKMPMLMSCAIGKPGPMARPAESSAAPTESTGREPRRRACPHRPNDVFFDQQLHGNGEWGEAGRRAYAHRAQPRLHVRHSSRSPDDVAGRSTADIATLPLASGTGAPETTLANSMVAWRRICIIGPLLRGRCRWFQ